TPRARSERSASEKKRRRKSSATSGSQLRQVIPIAPASAPIEPVTIARASRITYAKPARKSTVQQHVDAGRHPAEEQVGGNAEDEGRRHNLHKALYSIK